jgi:TM2 domain-containing membrane protein YozV
MNRSTKAALLSGLVFPGAGHFYLKRWIEGVLLSGGAFYALYILTSVAWNTAIDITRQIESGTVAADVDTITLLVTQQLQASEGATNLASIALVTFWVLGIITAYWQGREKEPSHEQP